MIGYRNRRAWHSSGESNSRSRYCTRDWPSAALLSRARARWFDASTMEWGRPAFGHSGTAAIPSGRGEDHANGNSETITGSSSKSADKLTPLSQAPGSAPLRSAETALPPLNWVRFAKWATEPSQFVSQNSPKGGIGFVSQPGFVSQTARPSPTIGQDFVYRFAGTSMESARYL
jgi:hypothetical protein